MLSTYCYYTDEIKSCVLSAFGYFLFFMCWKYQYDTEISTNGQLISMLLP